MQLQLRRSLTPFATVVAIVMMASTAMASVVVPPGSLTVPNTGTFLYLNSQPGDPIGGGGEWLYLDADSIFWKEGLPLGESRFHKLVARGPDLWWIDLFAPLGEPLAVGSYTDALFGGPSGTPGINVSGNSHTCTSGTGQFDVTELSYTPEGDLLVFDATFEQHCNGATAALFGRIRVEIPPPTPGVTLPAGSIAVPTSGSFLYLNSDPGDYIGAGLEQLFTPANADLTSFFLIEGGDYFTGRAIHNGAYWFANIAAPAGEPLTVGSYIRAVGAIGWAVASPSLAVYGDGRGCTVTGAKFDVDEVSYAPTGDLLVFQATFEQHCDNSNKALHGRIRIENAAPTPVVLPSGSLTVPTSGTFLYLNSQAGDYAGAGAEQLFTGGDSTFRDSLAQGGESFGASVTKGTHAWEVDLAATLGQALAARSYTRAVLPAARLVGNAGLDVHGDGRVCGWVTGKFDVNELSFWPNGELHVFQATFEQHCENAGPALFGRVRVDNLPTLGLGVTVREEGTVSNKTGVAVVSGTLTCSRSARVDVSVSLSEMTSNNVVVSGSGSSPVDCVAGTSAKWSVSVPGSNGRFNASNANASVTASRCEWACWSAEATRVVKLNSSK